MNVTRPRRWTRTVIHYGYVEFAFNYKSLHAHHFDQRRSVRKRQHIFLMIIYYIIFILLLPTKIYIFLR